MAKGKTLVAKSPFDDGTKKGENGKSMDYTVGENYQGTPAEAKIMIDKGLLASPEEFEASKEVLDEKDKKIRLLEAKLEESRMALEAAEKHASDLQDKLDNPKA